MGERDGRGAAPARAARARARSHHLGRVVAVDLDARFLRALPPENLEVREEDVVDAELPADAFDLVHARCSHPAWARDLPHEVAALGLAVVRAEAEFPWFHGGSELAEFWKISWGLVRDAVAGTGADVSPWDREIATKR